MTYGEVSCSVTFCPGFTQRCQYDAAGPIRSDIQQGPEEKWLSWDVFLDVAKAFTVMWISRLICSQSSHLRNLSLQGDNLFLVILDVLVFNPIHSSWQAGHSNDISNNPVTWVFPSMSGPPSARCYYSLVIQGRSYKDQYLRNWAFEINVSTGTTELFIMNPRHIQRVRRTKDFVDLMEWSRYWVVVWHIACSQPGPLRLITSKGDSAETGRPPSSP